MKDVPIHTGKNYSYVLGGNNGAWSGVTIDNNNISNSYNFSSAPLSWRSVGLIFTYQRFINR